MHSAGDSKITVPVTQSASGSERTQGWPQPLLATAKAWSAEHSLTGQEGLGAFSPRPVVIIAAPNSMALGHSRRAATGTLPSPEPGHRDARAGGSNFNATLLEDPN